MFWLIHFKQFSGPVDKIRESKFVIVHIFCVKQISTSYRIVIFINT